MKETLAVALGGLIGSVGRYWLSCNLANWSGTTAIGSLFTPLAIAILVVNLMGCLAIGVVSVLPEKMEISEVWQVGIRVGLLGGFTTFSSFALDASNLLNQQRIASAIGLVGCHVILGIVAVFIGQALARSIL